MENFREFGDYSLIFDRFWHVIVRDFTLFSADQNLTPLERVDQTIAIASSKLQLSGIYVKSLKSALSKDFDVLIEKQDD